jgi:hypothetical protein
MAAERGGKLRAALLLDVRLKFGAHGATLQSVVANVKPNFYDV